jgi:ATP-dependent RNA/DNA helicase IGHMBP2
MEEIDRLRELLKIEEKDQEQRWNNSTADYKTLRSEGALLYPVHVNRKSFGFADYPQLQFSFPHPLIGNHFKSGTAITLFVEEERYNGIIQNISDHQGEVLLYTSDFPSFDSGDKIGIRLAPDTRTFDQMHGILKRIQKQENKVLNKLYEITHGKKTVDTDTYNHLINWRNQTLNDAQKSAVLSILADNPISIVHGPPGTGKTTTLVEAIIQLVNLERKVIVSAPSNAAVDHLAEGLLKAGASILRLGNTNKTNETIQPYTPEGILQKPENVKQIKKLRQQSDELRRMTSQYKRQFGKEEREQRQLIKKEIQSIQNEIKSLSSFFLAREISNNTIILGTPVALRDKLVQDFKPDYFILDEAGQCLEPLAWLGADYAEKMVLAGDPFQLPPTVISEDAAKKGLSVSILEVAFGSNLPTCLLDTQYRMPKELISFSSQWFYDGKLKSAIATAETEQQLLFIDSAGADFAEDKDDSGGISNPDELNFVANHLMNHLPAMETAFISPYAAQVFQAKQLFDFRCSTIDSFQGQEIDRVIISLVRSNKDGQIGFLKDYRRMNVAITRAKKQLILIGDSTTLEQDEFFAALIRHIEDKGGLRSVFEYLYD